MASNKKIPVQVTRGGTQAIFSLCILSEILRHFV